VTNVLIQVPDGEWIVEHPVHPRERMVIRHDVHAPSPTTWDEYQDGVDTDSADLIRLHLREWDAQRVYRLVLQDLQPTIPAHHTLPGMVIARWVDVAEIPEVYLDLEARTPLQIAAEHWYGWDTPSQNGKTT
jgi:hypothetical protein